MSSTEKIKKKQSKYCKECEEKKKPSIDECFKCPWHHFMNENFKKAVGEL